MGQGRKDNMQTPSNGAVAAGDRSERTPGQRDFRLLWAGQSTSLLGDQLMVVALPLLAVVTLGHSPAEAALLPFALFLPFLVLGLPAGAIADRCRPRLALMTCDAVQLAAFTTIALLASARLLPFALLLFLVAVAGCGTVFFQVCYSSYLPHLLTGEHALIHGNSRLFLSESLSRTLGPMTAGPIIALAGPLVAVAVNASTFLVSLLTLKSIRHREPKPAVPERQPGWMRREIREGLSFAFSHPLLQPVLLCGCVYVLFLSMVEATLVLYSREVLQLSPVGIGLVVGAAAAGFPIGNAVSGHLYRRLGVAWTLVLSASMSVAGLVCMPVAGNALHSVVGLVIASVVHGVGEGTFGPTSLTLRQTATPPHLLGRVNAVQRFLVWGTVPVGSLIASCAIALSGLPAAMWIGGLGTALCLPMLVRRGILEALVAGPVWPRSQSQTTPAAPEPSSVAPPS